MEKQKKEDESAYLLIFDIFLGWDCLRFVTCPVSIQAENKMTITMRGEWTNIDKEWRKKWKTIQVNDEMGLHEVYFFFRVF